MKASTKHIIISTIIVLAFWAIPITVVFLSV